MNTGNAIKIFDVGGLKVTRAVPEKHIINYIYQIIIIIIIPKNHRVMSHEYHYSYLLLQLAELKHF